MTPSKNINYLNKTFGEYKDSLIEFAKTYFSSTYRDFNEADPGMMFIEMAAYVGDVLSFYIDEQFKESLLTLAEERRNVYLLAQSLGYSPKNTSQAITELDVFQLLPSIGENDSIRPDYRYSLRINPGMVVGSNTNKNVEFRTIDTVDFTFSSSLSPMSVSVYETDAQGQPTYYLLKKSVKVVSGKINTKNFTFGSAKPYDKITINEPNIIGIESVVDDDGGTWHEVPYLAQDMIFESKDNILENNPSASLGVSSQPSQLLNLRKTSKRFITRLTDNDQLEIRFGSGISNSADQEIIPNPQNVGSQLYEATNQVGLNIDPTNFLYTKSYGVVPSNTVLTVRYLTGNGLVDNVASNDLTEIREVFYGIDSTGLDLSTLGVIKRSVACTNPKAATGGRSKESLEEIKQNTLSHISAQNRAVTKDDYIMRCYALPSKYGSISKAYIEQDSQLGSSNTSQINPFALNLYTLGQNDQGHLVVLNPNVKGNLRKYLDYYRMLTDAINIKDAFIINLSLEFEIISQPGYNGNEVLLRCISKLKDFFRIDNWSISQPIILSDIYTLLDRIDGVQTVKTVTIFNESDSTKGYSENIYNIEEATKEGIIYPALDPSIFEIKYPNQDIRGKVRSLF